MGAQNIEIYCQNNKQIINYESLLFDICERYPNIFSNMKMWEATGKQHIRYYFNSEVGGRIH